MAKQTLFEAEGVITINAGKMLSGLDAAIAQAQAKLNNAFSNMSLPAPGGGGRGGRGGGGGGAGGSNQWTVFYNLERERAKQEAAIGRLISAERILANLSRHAMLTEEQRQRAETARLAMAQKIADKRVKIETEQKKTADKKDVNSGRLQREHFGDQMAEARRLKNAHDYIGALNVINGLLTGQLTRRQQIQALDLKNRTEQQHALFDPNMLTPGARRANAATQNASFAIQDFITVLSMGGGMSRALASASNNVAFMASMMGTLKGAAIGLGATLLAVFLPSLVKAAMGLKDIGDYAKEAEKRVDSLRKAMDKAAAPWELKFDVEDMSADGPDSLRKGLAEAEREKIKEQARLNRASFGADKLTGLGALAAQDAIKSQGNFRGEANDQFLRDMEDVRQGKLNSTELRARAEQMSADEAYSGLGLGTRYEYVAEQLEKAEKELADSQEKMGEIADRILAITQAIGQTEMNVFDAGILMTPWGMVMPGSTSSGPIDGAAEEVRRNKRAQAEADKARRLEINQLQKKVPALRSMFETLFPKEAEIESIKQRYEDAFPTNMSPEVIAMRDFEISQVKNKPLGSISGTMDGADFANQLTNQLLRSDPQTKIAQEAAKHTGLLETIRDDSKRSADRLEELQTSAITD